MKTAKKTILSLVVLSLALSLPATARADWNPGDPYKYLQPPDLTTNGMDVNATGTYDDWDFVNWDPIPGDGTEIQEVYLPKVLADDFDCRQTGYITDIHIWGSWKDDILPQDFSGASDPSNVVFGLGIHEDIPATADDYSTPGELLWYGFFLPGNFDVSSQEVSGESWYDPNNPDQYNPEPTDFNIYQYNFDIEIDSTDCLIEPAFLQEGTSEQPIVYWLSVLAIPDPELLADGFTSVNDVIETEPMFGWKTTPLEHHWNDDAVWTDAYPEEGSDFTNPANGIPYTVDPWQELRYPSNHLNPNFRNQSIDLSFVITPEPATLLVLGLGLIPALLKRRRKV